VGSRVTHVIVRSSCLFLVATVLPAQSVLRQGGEFQVNQYTTNNQYQPSVAASASGDFVVSWSSAGQESPGTPGIFAARFDSSGALLGGELQVNSYTTGIQRFSAVASADDGDFVVVWQSYQDGNLEGIFGRRFASTGTPLAAEFQVNSYTLGFQVQPDVAADDDGDFVVVWRSTGQDGITSHGVFGRRFDSSGAAQASEFQVSTYTVGNQAHPSVALEGNGDFVVAWQSTNLDGSGYAVIARRFSSAGVAQGLEIQANVYTVNNQAQPAVAVDADGDFVVAWQSLQQDGPIPLGDYGIFARPFDSVGVARGGEFQVNVYTTDFQGLSDVAADDDGDFVVTWQSRFQDGSLAGVFGRRFNVGGTALGPEFQVNSYTVGQQGDPDPPAIDFDADGDFVIAWRTTEPQDGHFAGIFAQRFSLPPLAVLDVDGNGMVGPLTDGLLHLRRRFSFSGSTLISGAVAANCTRCSAGDIQSYLDNLGSTLDIDDNGALEPLTDGLLVLRFMFGFTGATLTTGAVDTQNCGRCDPAAIALYLQTLI
jgi:hypothetical protein